VIWIEIQLNYLTQSGLMESTNKPRNIFIVSSAWFQITACFC